MPCTSSPESVQQSFSHASTRPIERLCRLQSRPMPTEAFEIRAVGQSGRRAVSTLPRRHPQPAPPAEFQSDCWTELSPKPGSRIVQLIRKWPLHGTLQHSCLLSVAAAQQHMPSRSRRPDDGLIKSYTQTELVEWPQVHKVLKVLQTAGDFSSLYQAKV